MTKALYASAQPKETDPLWIGIDACRGGWILAMCSVTQPLQLKFAPHLADLLKQVPRQAIALIDMILYDPNDLSPRQFDHKAKALLGKWHSRVFAAPPKECLNAQNYVDACMLSHQRTGKKISIQCYNLFPKIREANALFHPPADQSESANPQLLEYHPEIAFLELNQGHPIAPSKKSPEGRSIRRHCLKAFFGSLPNEPIHAFRQKPWVEDDLLDALALTAAAQTGTYQQFYQALRAQPSDLKHIEVD